MAIELSENISEYIHSVFGDEYLKKYIDYVNSDLNHYIRIPKKEVSEHLIESLENQSIKLEPIENIVGGYRVLEGKELLGKTFEFSIGKFYIQSLSSMIPPLVLQPTEEDKTLDLCSAPGSKSTQLSELMENKGTLYSNESNLSRIKSLVFNIDKMNKVNMGVIKYKGELLSKWFENEFDKILVDAPCSALGIVQKKNEVSNWWNVNQMEKIAELQLRLLISAIKMAKVGAEIVYSTCTLTIQENELVLHKLLRRYPIEILEIELPIKSSPGITYFNGQDLNPDVAKAHRIVPWETNSEGFFVCKLRKTGEAPSPKKESAKQRNIELVPSNHNKMKKYLQDIHEWFGIPMEILNDYQYLVNKRDINFIHKNWQTDNLSSFIRIGTKFGSVDKRDMCHFHSHGAQFFGKHATKNTIELTDTSEMKTYLSGGTIRREIQPYGQKIVYFRGYIAGTAVTFKDGIKSQLPRAMRMSEIII